MKNTVIWFQSSRYTIIGITNRSQKIHKGSYIFFAISRHSLDQLFIFEFVSSHINNIFIGQIWSRLTRKIKHHFKSQKRTILIAKLTKNLLGSKCLLQNCKIMEVVRTKFSTVLKNSYKLGKKNCLNNLTSEQKLKILNRLCFKENLLPLLFFSYFCTIKSSCQF